jgi:hypothetical protein
MDSSDPKDVFSTSVLTSTQSRSGCNDQVIRVVPRIAADSIIVMKNLHLAAFKGK